MTEDSEKMGKKNRKRTKSVVPPAPLMTSPSSMNSSVESAVEKVKREAEEDIAREREKRKESE